MGSGHESRPRSAVELLKVVRVENVIFICRAIPLWVVIQ